MRIATPALLMLLLAACKGGKGVLAPKDLPVRSAEKVAERLHAAQPGAVAYYSAKADVGVKAPGMDREFKATLRSVQDSALWVSINVVLGIEAARGVITRDSVKALDKINDRYWLGDSSQARNKFGTLPSLALIQEVLLGRAIGLDLTDKYRVDREDGLYVLTSRDKRRFVRAAGDISPDDTLAGDKDMKERRLERTLRKAEDKDAMIYRYWVEPDSFRVARVLITDFTRDRQADIRYDERAHDLPIAPPTRILITLSDAGTVLRIKLTLSRIELNGPLQLPFRIPEKFQPMD
ncbi:MAG: DUF4292 domain-containing protein [Flavobacteriales bacterium]|nr:DUF4292 domain-containing protein [Flavobacteriales bacterium]